jgi:viroplasmin and RNaseH domain-containing protein
MKELDFIEFSISVETANEEWKEFKILNIETVDEIIDNYTIRASMDELAEILKLMYGGEVEVIDDDKIKYRYTGKDTLVIKLFGGG